MDPLSMTASVIAVVQLTISLTSYLNDVRNAASEQKQLALETTSLSGLLISLRYRLEEARAEDKWFNEIKALGAQGGPLQQFRDVLESMAEKTITSQMRGLRDRIKSALTWSLNKNDVEKSLMHIERLKTYIQIALSNDAFKLAQAIHTEVVSWGGATRQIQTSVEQLQIHANEDTLDRISRWLGVPDCSTNYTAAQDKRHPGTGSWLLESQSFNDWKAATSSLLWIHGKAGCGKTVLSATALESIYKEAAKQPGTAIAYFYFDFNDSGKQRLSHVIRSLLLQLALQLPNSLSALKQLYHRCGDGSVQPTREQVDLLLFATLESTTQIYLVFDALDECHDQKELMIMIDNLVTSSRYNICMLATSRLEKELDESLRTIAEHILAIEAANVTHDIDTYIQGRLIADKKLKRWPEKVKAEIAHELNEKADGMFRWVFCQLESLQHCVKLSALRKTLSMLPTTLDDTYTRILEDIQSRGHLSDALKILQWLCFSYCPLRLAELVDMLAIEERDNGTGGFDPEERLPDPNDIMTICSSLIDCYSSAEPPGDEIDGLFEVNFEFDDNPRSEHLIWVRLAHFSVKEYLLSDRCTLRPDFKSTTCHTVLSRSCLYYLQTVSRDPGPADEIVDIYPLADYSARFWWRHLQEIREDSSALTTNLAFCFLMRQEHVLTWIRLHGVGHEWEIRDPRLTAESLASPLYYAALIGSFEVTRSIISQASIVDVRGGYQGTALHAAARGGHKRVLQLLLNRVTDVGAAEGHCGMILSPVSVGDDQETAQALLDVGAKVNVLGGHYGTALHAASCGGHLEVVQFLLDKGANVNTLAGFYGTALQAASWRGHDEVARLLLGAGANVNAQGGRWGTAIYAASAASHEVLVQTLLEAGAHVNGQGYWRSPLSVACGEGHERLVEILLNAGAKNYRRTLEIALEGASQAGHEAVVGQLLRAGARAKTSPEDDDAVLHQAALRGHIGVVERLLNVGWNINIQYRDQGTALQTASRKGREAMVRLLLDAGADVNATGGQYGSALRAASAMGHTEIVQLLRERGADSDEEA